MGQLAKIMGVGAFAAIVGGCVATPDPFAVKNLPKGEQLNIRNILAAHPNKRACVDYEAATNSCASIITSTIEGNTMVSNEIAALKIPGSTSIQNIEVVSRSMLQGDRVCVRAPDVTITGRDPMSASLLGGTRDMINEFGGAVCGTYYRAGDGYVVNSVGANGETFPPGDTKFQFILGDLKLRAQ
ncbi:hypothetical protein [uncultured Sulfitobacter sp.]|uniref:hypothetical protein n=1 Tax=uncultured Sulfitobacter sp. TaxID=191468 RepID=UPI002624685B|nr:hypothetical protein [uncultured Sulfitobacter sp.]